MALPCDNFYEFKKLLTTFRDEDDKVIYRLNALLPTASFSDKVSILDLLSITDMLRLCSPVN